MPRNGEPIAEAVVTGFARAQWNVIYLLVAAGALMAALSVAIQPLLLDQIFGIAFEKEGAINADIEVVAEIISIICVGWFGLMSDRVGRVRIIAFGFLTLAAGAAAVTTIFNKSSIKVTVSCGGAQYSQEDTITQQEFIEAADKGLYLSKENGRNRVTIVDIDPKAQ